MSTIVKIMDSNWLVVGAIALVFLLYKVVPQRANLPIHSTHAGPFASWHDSLEYLKDSPGVLRSGYEKFSRKGLFYQLRTPVRWVIVVPPKFVDEIRTAPPDHLSAKVSANDVCFIHFVISVMPLS